MNEPMNKSQTQSQTRVLTGSVTKLLDNFGFIDDSVFFQLSVVKGVEKDSISVGDKVYCECSYSEHLPFKWNATKVHLVQSKTNNNNNSGNSAQQSSQSQQSSSSPAAQTYLQHRLQQELNQNQTNYYSTQQPFDFSKAQHAIQLAQQQYTAFQQNQNQFPNQLQYTSTPGSAFISSSTITPFQQQRQPQNNYSTKSSSSRWESRIEDNSRSSHSSSSRQSSRESRFRDQLRDEFGRDLRQRDKEREVRNNRNKKRSESPVNQIQRVQRRRYEPINIPKLALLKNPLNVYDIKQRYSQSLHIPSDLKEVIVNSKFTFNLNLIPKPITFRVIDSSKDSTNKRLKDSPKKSSDITEIDLNNEKSNQSTEQQIIKNNNKYGVKVLIISLPSMNDIYDRIFGSDFDAINNGSKVYFLHFNKLLAFLVSRNANDGFSLIGGKFNPQLDGFIDNLEPNLIQTAIRVVSEQTGMNLSKCSKWKLVATFVYNRDSSVDPLNPCVEITKVFMPDIWSALDSTIYSPINRISNDLTENNLIENNLKENVLKENNDLINDLNIDSVSNNEQHLTTTMDTTIEDLTPNVSDNNQQQNETQLTTIDSNSSEMIEEIVEKTSPSIELSPKTSPQTDECVVVNEESDNQQSLSLSSSSPNSSNRQTIEQQLTQTNPNSSCGEEKTSNELIESSVLEKTKLNSNPNELQLLLSRINDMKVTELRAELEKRGAKIKSNLKKAELLEKLRQMIIKLIEDDDVVSDEVKGDWWTQRILIGQSGDNKDNENQHKESDDKIDDKEENISINIDKENNEKETKSNNNKEEENENEIEMQEIDSQKSTENEPIKRKNSSVESEEKETKKAKNGNEVKEKEIEEKAVESETELFPKKVIDGCVYVKGGENLTVITLHEALNHQRYDQFEMSIVSELIRESLIHHFSHYIISTLIHNYNNNSNNNQKTKESEKELKEKTPLQVNYVHLSFAYFDSHHCGHILSEDLSKLLNNANFTFSRKAFNLLVNNEDKVIYRDLIPVEDLLDLKQKTNSENNENNEKKKKMIEKNGTLYNIEKLIEDSENDQKLKVKLSEELIANKEKIEQLNEYINELENKQKKMTIATEKQNDEICSLKRDKDLIKNKYDSLRKTVEISVNSVNEVLKIQSEENKN